MSAAPTAEERRLLAASLHNQFLLQKGPRLKVASALLGLQAQFANCPKVALRIRASDFSEDGWAEGLVKTWTFRCTIHDVRRDELALYLSARGRGQRPEWTNDWRIPASVKPYWSDFLLERIRAGQGEREGLKAACRAAGMEESLSKAVFNGWGGLLLELCERGAITYDCGTAKRFLPCEGVAFTNCEEARAELLRRYFATYGPATLADAATFTGYKMTGTRALLKNFDIPRRVHMIGGREYFSAGDPAFEADVPACVFLSGFDQLMLGYSDRSRMMDARDRNAAITCSGILHPVILVDGRLRARWRKDGRRVSVSPFHSLTKKQWKAVDRAAQALFSDEAVEVVHKTDKESDGART